MVGAMAFAKERLPELITERIARCSQAIARMFVFTQSGRDRGTALPPFPQQNNNQERRPIMTAGMRP